MSAQSIGDVRIGEETDTGDQDDLDMEPSTRERLEYDKSLVGLDVREGGVIDLGESSASSLVEGEGGSFGVGARATA